MLGSRSGPTRTTPPAVPAGRRTLAWAAAALAAGAAVVVAYDVERIRRMRAVAPAGPLPLDHTALVGEGLGEPLDLMVLGDSAAAGYGNSDARDAFPYQLGSRMADRLGARVRISSLATSGARTADLTTDQVPLLARDGADVVVVSVGVNDAIGRRRAPQVHADTSELLDAVAAAVPEATVVLVGCPDLSTAPGFPSPLGHLVGWRGKVVRRAQAAAAAEHEVAFVAYPRPPDPEMFGPDGFHPGPAGQAAAADAVVAVLAPIVATEERPWTSA